MKTTWLARFGLIGALFVAGCGSSTAQEPGDASVESGDDASAVETGRGSCGDGVVNGNEACDDGSKNGTMGDPCTASCSWVCIAGDPMRGDTACNSGKSCSTMSTCQADHTCSAGVPLEAGTSCGTGEICNGGVCAQAVCGDGIVTAPEECDDGSNNGSATDGCTKACKFVCVTSDPTRNCTPSDPCKGQGTCNDKTHVCTAGTPESNGTACTGASSADGGISDAGAGVCNLGSCVPGYCGDGIVESGEQCDLGAGNGPGAGCELDCTFSCSTAKPCTTTDVCKGTSTCTVLDDGGAQKCVVGAPPTPGTMCGSGDAGAAGKCQQTDGGEVCITNQCGDGIVESGEQCDFGSGNNVAGSGCDPDCQFSCQMATPNSCQSNLCAANPTVCTAVKGPNQSGGQKCEPATEVASCGDCSPGGVCKNNACATSVCGDSCVDSRTGETCDPPNGTTCDSHCHTITAAVCGNGVRETGEQCDDGNTTNLDGCDSKCQFEQEQRANSLSIEFSTSTFCPNNALGLAIGKGIIASTAQGTVSQDLTDSVNAGTTSIEWKFMGITDLTGQSQSSGLSIGTFSGAPAGAPTGVTYDGGSDLDWWYTTAGSTIDANRTPLSLTPATFSSAVLTATNGSMVVTISLAGQASTMDLSGVNIQAHVGKPSPPTESASGNTPGHVASEHLDPTLQSFASMNNGLLCGNISAESLSKVPVPSALESGIAACGNVTYGAMNHLLDVLVVGCTKGIVGAVISATQPDQLTPAAPAGAKFQFTADPTTHIVTGCTNNGAAAPLATCLAGAAYSGYFGFTSDRVIAK